MNEYLIEITDTNVTTISVKANKYSDAVLEAFNHEIPISEFYVGMERNVKLIPKTDKDI
jgi:hypothetical protein